MKQIALDSSLKKLSTDTLTLQIGPAELPLASFLFVLSFYGENLGGHGFVTVLSTIVLQALLDRARGDLPSDTRTLISHWEIFHGKIGKIWKSVIATCMLYPVLAIDHMHRHTSLQIQFFFATSQTQ